MDSLNNFNMFSLRLQKWSQGYILSNLSEIETVITSILPTSLRHIGMQSMPESPHYVVSGVRGTEGSPTPTCPRLEGQGPMSPILTVSEDVNFEIKFHCIYPLLVQRTKHPTCQNIAEPFTSIIVISWYNYDVFRRKINFSRFGLSWALISVKYADNGTFWYLNEIVGNFPTEYLSFNVSSSLDITNISPAVQLLICIYPDDEQFRSKLSLLNIAYF